MPVKNTLGDLNDFLFAQLESLSDPELHGDELENEIRKSKAVCQVSQQIISNANTVLEAQKVALEYDPRTNSQSVQTLIEMK